MVVHETPARERAGMIAALVLVLATATLAAPQDDLALLPGDAVQLGGLLGARGEASRRARLLAADEAALLAGFQHRPGTQAWIGEHAGKWLHAACLAQQASGDGELAEKIGRVREALLACQEADGYLGTYLPAQRFGLQPGTDWDVWVHKYCLLGLLADFQRSGAPKSLASAEQIGELLCRTFAPGRTDLLAAGTHQGMAATSVLEPMVLLHRATGNARYLAFARAIVQRWAGPAGPDLLQALRSDTPLPRVANGKAYEMLSNLVGLCELCRATGERELLEPLLNAHRDVVTRRLWPTGSGSVGEHWNHDGQWPDGPYDAIAETCVTVTWLQFNAQLLRLTGLAGFGDELEKTAFNHLLAAQHPDGAAWCDYTPLRGTRSYRRDTSCCASSGPRGLALLPSVAAFAGSNGPRVNLLVPMTAKFGGARPDDGIVLHVESEYPFRGAVRIRVGLAKPQVFELGVRIPRTVRVVSAVAGGQRVNAWPGKWLQVEREWRDGDRLELDLDLTLAKIDGTPFGQPGRLAYRRGPLVLAATGADAALTVAAPAIARERLVPFATAGADGAPYRVWLWRDDAAMREHVSVLGFGRESASRAGNRAGSILDGDRRSFRVTWDGGSADQDWFAAQLDQPVTIGRVVYRHGATFHDGGWFDATAGKPRIEVQRTGDGPWEPLGPLADYPETTATEAKELKPGQPFVLTCEPTAVVAVRVVGRGASGDAPGQRFASCAELEAWAR